MFFLWQRPILAVKWIDWLHLHFPASKNRQGLYLPTKIERAGVVVVMAVLAVGAGMEKIPTIVKKARHSLICLALSS
jgi:hypothetical protein